ncbi:MAG TPA: helix-turn-helix domain-containing protein [Alphaproteobacteria bacterium]|nr:helix-turn-helix domain-containing protein [Alphaproteobacteria bacterium]
MTRTNPPARLVVTVAYDDALLLDVAGPLQAFATANDILAEETNSAAAYRLVVASRRGGLVRAASGLSVMTTRLADLGRSRMPIDTLIIAGGPGVHAATADGPLVAWIARAAQKARRACSVCTGAFLLAATGLLDGRRVATHWRSAARLQARHPALRVDPDPIYIREGKLWTSAGVTAGIDLALALIEADLGRRLAMEVARRLVVFLKRPGGQAQFSAPLDAQMRAAESDAEGRFAALHAWMAENLTGDLRVERLAARAGMSPRSFARVYAARTGTTPARRVEMLRVEAARRALEETRAPVKRIAHRCGFGDEERMRRAFLRRLGVNPLEYRRRFAA